MANIFCRTHGRRLEPAAPSDILRDTDLPTLLKGKNATQKAIPCATARLCTEFKKRSHTTMILHKRKGRCRILCAKHNKTRQNVLCAVRHDSQHAVQLQISYIREHPSDQICSCKCTHGMRRKTQPRKKKTDRSQKTSPSVNVQWSLHVKNRRSLEPMNFPLGNDSCETICRNITVVVVDIDDDDSALGSV